MAINSALLLLTQHFPVLLFDRKLQIYDSKVNDYVIYC